MDVTTIGCIGGAITWALHTWKQTEEIRKIRRDAERVEALSDDDIAQIFDDKIQETIRNQIDAKVNEMIGPANDEPGRHHEQRDYLSWALEYLVALVERGLKVEIRYLPPPQPEDAEEGEAAELPAEFQALDELIPKLVFHFVKDQPVTKLPPPEPPDEDQDDQA